MTHSQPTPSPSDVPRRIPLQPFLLWFLPPRVRPTGRDDLRRALLVIGGSFLTAIIATAVAMMQFLWAVPIAGVVSLGAGFVAALLPFWIRRTGHWQSTAAILTAAVWIPALGISIATGGVLIAALYYLVLGAAMAALTVGPRMGLVLGVVNALVVAAIVGARHVGMVPPVVVDNRIAIESAMRGAFTFNLALAALVAAYEFLRSAALRESDANERRFRALADYGPDLIAELDPAGRVVASSTGGGDLAAALAGVVSGAPSQDAIHADDRASVVAAFAQLARESSVRVGPLRWARDHGGTTWVEAALTRYPAAQEDRTLVVARDVSERIELEAHLRQSQKMQAVGQLASGLSHDFNNVLMAILGNSEILAARMATNPMVRETAAEIRLATEQGAALTRRLLGLANPAPAATRVLDVSAVVRDCEKLLRVVAGEAVTLTVDARPALPVRADAGELEQVLVNLVANARDALGPNGTVCISTARDGDRAAVAVRDSGKGIDPAVRDRIFDPFFTTKASGGGTGLGLYVVYTVVSRLGGEVKVESEPGEGTRFTILLPLAEAGPRKADTAASPPAAGGRERILLVEDRVELRDLLRRWLEMAGYDVTVAADGVEALALGVRQAVDLVVTDVVMPRMGGPALVAALREGRPSLPVLFISGGPPTHDTLAATDRILRKPFIGDALLHAVREALDARATA